VLSIFVKFLKYEKSVRERFFFKLEYHVEPKFLLITNFYYQ